ncbi:hypothetical protein ACFQFG_08385 [Methylobacterium persicinum]
MGVEVIEGDRPFSDADLRRIRIRDDDGRRPDLMDDRHDLVAKATVAQRIGPPRNGMADDQRQDDDGEATKPHGEPSVTHPITPHRKDEARTRNAGAPSMRRPAFSIISFKHKSEAKLVQPATFT